MGACMVLGIMGAKLGVLSSDLAHETAGNTASILGV